MVPFCIYASGIPPFLNITLCPFTNTTFLSTHTSYPFQLCPFFRLTSSGQMLCCSSVNRLLHSELPAFGSWDRVSDHHMDCILADKDHNLVHVADRGHAHVHRLDRDLVPLHMSDRHFLVPVFGKGPVLVHVTDTWLCLAACA